MLHKASRAYMGILLASMCHQLLSRIVSTYFEKAGRDKSQSKYFKHIHAAQECKCLS